MGPYVVVNQGQKGRVVRHAAILSTFPRTPGLGVGGEAETQWLGLAVKGTTASDPRLVLGEVEGKGFGWEF